VYLTLQPLPVL